MPKRATPVILTDREQEALVQGTKRHRSEQQQVLRARTVLAAAEGRSNAQIARELAINVDTMRLWRDRWVGLQGIDWDSLTVTERFQDAPLPGTPVIGEKGIWSVLERGGRMTLHAPQGWRPRCSSPLGTTCYPVAVLMPVGSASLLESACQQAPHGWCSLHNTRSSFTICLHQPRWRQGWLVTADSTLSVPLAWPSIAIRKLSPSWLLPLRFGKWNSAYAESRTSVS